MGESNGVGTPDEIAAQAAIGAHCLLEFAHLHAGTEPVSLSAFCREIGMARSPAVDGGYVTTFQVTVDSRNGTATVTPLSHQAQSTPHGMPQTV